MEEIQYTTEDYKKRIADYREVIAGFSEVLDLENIALKEYDTDKAAALFERKTKMVAAYRSLVAFFIKNQDALMIMNDEEKASFKEISIKLDSLMKENEMLLKTRMTTSKAVINSIISAAKMNNNANSTSYGCEGKYSPWESSKNAIAVNRTL